MKLPNSNRTKFLSKVLNNKEYSRVIFLYLSYLGISVFILMLNKLILGDVIAVKISEFSQRFDSVLTFQESFSEMLLKSFVLIFTIYSFLIVIQSLSSKMIGTLTYLILAILVGLASGAGFGGGQISYLSVNGAIISIIGQIEWLAGAFLISAVPAFNKIHKNTLLIGIILLSISIVLNSLILAK